ncbi:DcaP family trimeric outer membrane transporter [Marinilabiliaceae bacterium ANBcel2]|nr:DcaP family trimeric outer membrane transporter [Marinilabiliaceae bacterium ANBcel2]
MMKYLYIVCALIFVATESISQDRLFNVDIYGMVAVDVAHNTRGSRMARNDHIYLYPLPSGKDNDHDINDRGTFDIDAAHSRFGLNVLGPEVNGISTLAVLEADFLGDARFADSNFRLRHAYLQLGYNNITFIVGQTWHPFFVPENFPQTGNTCVGVPMYPLSRNPQLRFSYRFNEDVEIIAALIEQNNFRSAGFVKGSEEAQVPETVIQLKLGGEGNAFATFSAGYKRLAIPQDISQTEDQPVIGSTHYQASFRYQLPRLTFRAGGIYGGNLTEHVIPGGVGEVIESSGTNSPEYEALKVATLWSDLEVMNETWRPGFFTGYLNRLGSSDEVDVIDDLSMDPGLSSLFVVSPRIRYVLADHINITLEYYFSRAGWGEEFDYYGVGDDVSYYNNHRSLLSFKYLF